MRAEQFVYVKKGTCHRPGCITHTGGVCEYLRILYITTADFAGPELYTHEIKPTDEVKFDGVPIAKKVRRLGDVLST